MDKDALIRGLKRLTIRPHSLRFWEIQEIAEAAIKEIEGESVERRLWIKEMGGVEQ